MDLIVNESEIKQEIGHRIKVCRVDNKMNHDDLANKVGIQKAQISGIERGERNINAIQLLKVTEALKIDMNRLFKNLKS